VTVGAAGQPLIDDDGRPVRRWRGRGYGDALLPSAAATAKCYWEESESVEPRV